VATWQAAAGRTSRTAYHGKPPPAGIGGMRGMALGVLRIPSWKKDNKISNQRAPHACHLHSCTTAATTCALPPAPRTALLRYTAPHLTHPLLLPHLSLIDAQRSVCVAWRLTSSLNDADMQIALGKAANTWRENRALGA